VSDSRIPRDWTMLESPENQQHDRCVDIFRRPDGSFGFEEFRRDVEDRGRWTPVSYFSGAIFASREAAMEAARKAVAWLD
jgi:hypothetical protein